MAIDYERMAKSGPKLKAQLTRAKKQGYDAVLKACQNAVAEWREIGCWPDNWAIWQRALHDACYDSRRPVVMMEDLLSEEEL